jgi:hypothetical protein
MFGPAISAPPDPLFCRLQRGSRRSDFLNARARNVNPLALRQPMRAFASKPKLVIADEPTTALDSAERRNR